MNSPEWLADNCRRIIATRIRMALELQKMGFLVTPSQANFIWCRHKTIDHRSIYDFLKQQQILVRLMDYGHRGDGLRISVGTDEQIDALLFLLANYVS
jgi:histidinol-phosphate aminotransferase